MQCVIAMSLTQASDLDSGSILSAIVHQNAHCEEVIQNPTGGDCSQRHGTGTPHQSITWLF